MKKPPDDGGLGGYQAATFKRGSTTYFNASLFFPPLLRGKVFALYAFVRRADDFVDAVPQDAAGFLSFRDYAEGRGPGAALTPADRGVVDAFRELSAQAGFDPAWTVAFLDAMQADLSRARYDTLEETLAYVYGSAEVVGLFMGRLMDLPGAADPGARLLGRAMQYINFIRDLDEDRGLGRRYLPLDGETPEIVDPDWARAHPERFAAWLRGHLDRYQAWQAEAVAAYPYIPFRYRIAVATAADMYWWTAAFIRRDPLIVFRRQVKPGLYRVFGRILFNALGGAGRSRK